MTKKNMKTFIAFFLFAVTVAHSGAIQGNVTLGKDSATIAGVQIHLVEKKMYVFTDERGNFLIGDLTAGAYALRISYAGYTAETISELTIESDTSHKTVAVNLKESPFQLGETVITATRTAKQLADVPVPTSIVSQKEIAARNVVRLDYILSEQTGLATTSFLGTGVQLQGLDPDYTLILIDGEPIIGRRGGTLDLKRINVGNVKQIEVVKGPTSALWGSDALAGVINIITETPHEPLSGKFSLRYGTYSAAELSTSLETKIDDFGAAVLLQRSSSDGYNFNKNSPAKTSPPFTGYTISPTLTYTLSSNFDWQISSRMYFEDQENPTVEKTSLTDWNVSEKATYKFSPTTKLIQKAHLGRYRNIEDFYSPSTQSFSEREDFDQTITKVEGEFSSAVETFYIVTAGAGAIYETVQADRIAYGKRDATSIFAYAQNEWIPIPWFDLIASYRFDSHSDYAARFSPKVSFMLRPVDEVTLRASYGSGFKAPTFQQLYLDFTNPAAGGYMVFGAVGIEERLNQEIDRGSVESILIDPKTIRGIRPEYSTAYNIGMDIKPANELLIKVNAFYNDIKDLIDAVAIARTVSGASIFSYINLNSVYTQGIESEIKYSPVEELTFSAGYQYLEAKDRQVLDDIRAGKIFKPTPTGARKVKESEYGGLLNRSKHSGNFKLLYSHEPTGTTLNLVFLVRDKYGYADLNGNLILDDKSEYVKGYALTNLSIRQQVWNTLSVYGGIDNVFDKTNPELIPQLSGRIMYGGISYQFK